LNTWISDPKINFAIETGSKDIQIFPQKDASETEFKHTNYDNTIHFNKIFSLLFSSRKKCKQHDHIF